MPAEGRARPARWSRPVRALHWGMAVLVIALLVLGFAMTELPFDLGTSFALYQWHKLIGLAVLALWLPRLAGRAAAAGPAAEAGWQGRAARAAHAALYVVMLAMPLTGWLATSASPLNLPLVVPLPFVGGVVLPGLIAPDLAAYEVLSRLHEILAFALLALLALHVAAVVKHVAFDHDDTLRRMTW